MTIDFGRLDPSGLALQSDVDGIEPTDHFVELYDDDRSLIDSVRTFISIGIGRKDAAVVFAGPRHSQAFDEELNRSIDLRTAREQGLYISVDAEEALSLFMQDGLPDPERFNHVLGDIIGRAAAKGKNVRVFGEMVALLWAKGNVAGALSVEDLWNRLSNVRRFRLFCAYPVSAFAEENLTHFGVVCSRHSHVIVPKVKAV